MLNVECRGRMAGERQEKSRVNDEKHMWAVRNSPRRKKKPYI
jgi:hypothetical protein